MLTMITQSVISRIKNQIQQLNQQLHGEEFVIYQTNTAYCCVCLINKNSSKITASYGFNANSNRDLGLLKAFFSLIMNTRKVINHEIAA